MKSRLIAPLLALVAVSFTTAQTVEGVSSTTAPLDVKAYVGSACILNAPETVALSPALYWTNPQNATGNIVVNVRCNLGTEFALSAPSALTLALGSATLAGTISGNVDTAVAGQNNTADTPDGQDYAFEVVVAASQLDVTQPAGVYSGSTTITMDLLGPPDPTDEWCPVLGPIEILYPPTAQ